MPSTLREGTKGSRGTLAAIHSGYWSIYLAGIALFLAMVRASHGGVRPLVGVLLAWPIVVIAVAPNAAAFYASYGPLFSRFLARRRLGSLLAGSVGLALAASAVGLALALLFFGARQPVFSRSAEFAALTLTLAAIAALHIAGGLVIRGFVDWYSADPAPKALESAAAPAASPRDVVFVKTEQRLEKVRIDEILLIEGQRDYRRIHTVDRRIMTLQTFAEFERQLPPGLICRVHKSYMVAVARIDSIERGRIAIQGLSVPISDTYRERFFALIGHR